MTQLAAAADAQMGLGYTACVLALTKAAEDWSAWDKAKVCELVTQADERGVRPVITHSQHKLCLSWSDEGEPVVTDLGDDRDVTEAVAKFSASLDKPANTFFTECRLLPSTDGAVLAQRVTNWLWSISSHAGQDDRVLRCAGFGYVPGTLGVTVDIPLATPGRARAHNCVILFSKGKRSRTYCPLCAKRKYKYTERLRKTMEPEAAEATTCAAAALEGKPRSSKSSSKYEEQGPYMDVGDDFIAIGEALKRGDLQALRHMDLKTDEGCFAADQAQGAMARNCTRTIKIKWHDTTMSHAAKIWRGNRSLYRHMRNLGLIVWPGDTQIDNFVNGPGKRAGSRRMSDGDDDNDDDGDDDDASSHATPRPSKVARTSAAGAAAWGPASGDASAGGNHDASGNGTRPAVQEELKFSYGP